VQVELANDKRRIKEAKRMQRLAMRKPGDDDDEEEEEEEEDAEEEAEEGVVVPKHPLTVQGESLLGD
jgi:ABC-type Zn2+ transport system substrate-binding protein/surface adhesin